MLHDTARRFGLWSRQLTGAFLWLEPFYAVSACSPRVCVCFLQVLRLPYTPNACRLIGDSKLSIGVNMSLNFCLSLWVSHVMNWQPVQGMLHVSSNVSWDQFQSHGPCKGQGWFKIIWTVFFFSSLNFQCLIPSSPEGDTFSCCSNLLPTLVCDWPYHYM